MPSRPKIVNADYATFIGTPNELREMLRAMFASADIVNVSYANFVVLARPLSDRQVTAAMETTPRRQR